MYENIIDFIKSLYPKQNPIPLHSPVFLGKEKDYLLDCVDSTVVSYIGEYVTNFEKMTAEYAGSKYAIAVVNGTAALQIALQVAGVSRGDEVITQALTFVATANAISHCGAEPVFIDVDLDTMGMSPEKLDDWMKKYIHISKEGNCINNITNKKVSAIVPMHTFGFPCKVDEIVMIANKYNIPVIEDAAESLGSFYKERHTGTHGLSGIFSYNGNKTITTGGGGMIVTDSEEFSQKAKHITTTGKIPHQYEYIHDTIAYNFRLPNVNAALGVAQMEYLDKIIMNKRKVAKQYEEFFRNIELKFFNEPENSFSNYWLNVIQLNNKNERDAFLQFTNVNGIMTRPIWQLMHRLKMYCDCPRGNLDNSEWLVDRIVNLPSSVAI